MFKKCFLLLILILISCSPKPAGDKSITLSNELFETYILAQHIDFQDYLRTILPEKDGYIVTGPLDPVNQDSLNCNAYHAIRIITLQDMINQAVNIVNNSEELSNIRKLECIFPGIYMDINWNNKTYSLSISTINQNRLLFWANQFDDKQILNDYMTALIDYLDNIDSGYFEAHPPEAVKYNLPEKYDLYAPPPEYVIEGYDNFINYLHAHDEIKSSFALGITAFIPTDSLLESMILNAPRGLYPNKEVAMFQKELKKFIERGGSLNSINTLTTDGFDTLGVGEYFFAVGLNGNIRFGKELSRSEVNKIEAESGNKPARANHSFLFPGEQVLTAGAFFVEIDEHNNPYISKVNAQSGHYFYSNINENIKDDIAVHSNEYMLTLGHFFKSLKKLNLPYKRILISKL